MKRRNFIKYTVAALVSAPFFHFANSPKGQKLLILGIDGMDPTVVNRLMTEGKLPNIKRLIQGGTFTMMHTTIPPQSPVAWASFMTGLDPGAMGIFDFIQRDPATYLPHISGAQTIPASMNIHIGKYLIPLKPGKVISKREGKTFWEILEERDIPATVFKIPSNYPPAKSNQRTLSGMGTPDITGGYGSYTLFTSDELEMNKDVGENFLYYAYIDENNVIKDGVIEGPVNDLVEGGEKVKVPFRVYVDDKHKTIRIDVQGKEILLAEKEISDWVEIKFSLIKNVSSITGMVRFYLLEMGKRFRLYVSPVHLSPLHPALPISTPSDYSQELAQQTGLFHTISLPCDVNALKQLTFTMENYITQSRTVLDESERIFNFEFDRFLNQKSGLLFFYFSPLDLGQHMFWALNDPNHPYFHIEEAQKFGSIRDEFYQEHDRILGRVLQKIPANIPIMAVSDHGFNPFYRKVNIGNWLSENGYLKLRSIEITDGLSIIENALWDETKAYFFGFNSIYLNLKGREANGVVKREDRKILLRELKNKLENIIDPKNGNRVIAQAYICEDVFSNRYLSRGPDIILGYNRGYRAGDTAAIGELSGQFLADNLNWWSGDHFVDPSIVPATFLANFKINKKAPHIMDMAPTILKFFNIDSPSTIKGKSVI